MSKNKVKLNPADPKATRPTNKELAQELLNTRTKIEALKEREKELGKQLIEQVALTGERNFGVLKAIEKTGAAKLVGLKNKALDVAINQLINELNATYVKKTLDVEAMYAAVATDKALLGHLTEKGLKIEQPISFTLKEI